MHKYRPSPIEEENYKITKEKNRKREETREEFDLGQVGHDWNCRLSSSSRGFRDWKCQVIAAEPESNPSSAISRASPPFHISQTDQYFIDWLENVQCQIEGNWTLTGNFVIIFLSRLTGSNFRTGQPNPPPNHPLWTPNFPFWVRFWNLGFNFETWVTPIVGPKSWPPNSFGLFIKGDSLFVKLSYPENQHILESLRMSLQEHPNKIETIRRIVLELLGTTSLEASF